jgi:hypothetical protein
MQRRYYALAERAHSQELVCLCAYNLLNIVSHYIHEQKDPLQFFQVAQALYALWPNVLLLFGAIYIVDYGDGQQPERKRMPLKGYITALRVWIYSKVCAAKLTTSNSTAMFIN